MEYDVDNKYVTKEITIATYMIWPYVSVWVIAFIMHILG